MSDQTGNLAILLVDVINKMPAHELVGDAATSPEVRDWLSLFQQIAVEGRGRVVKTVKDGAMFAFPDADSAVLAACEMQTHAHQNPTAPARNISIRIGLHFGSSFTAGVVAQRMTLLAASGQIITTGETKALLSAQKSNTIRQLVLPARAKQETVTVYEILWQPDVEQTQMPGQHLAMVREIAGPRLRLIHAAREIVVIGKITIGRRDSHGIALKNPAVSRDHAFIERRDDKFVLVDQSSNGTFIRLNDGQELKLSRSEMIMRGSGVLSFPRQASGQDAELVRFWCESKHIVAPQPAAFRDTRRLLRT